MTLKPEREHEALQVLRQQQRTPAWKAQYDKRAGIEGTLSQGIRAFGRVLPATVLDIQVAG